MATVLEIIGGAIVELGAEDAEAALSGSLPAWEADRGLKVLQAMFREAVDKGVFGRVEEVLATENLEAEEQQRVYSAGYTITLPTTIEDADTGEDRRPRDMAMIQVVNASTDPQISIYDANVAGWVRIDNLTLSLDPCPFSGRNRHGLECALAARLAGTFQRPVPPSAKAFSAGLGSVLTNRFSAPRQETQASYF